MNLSEYVINPHTNNATFDYFRFSLDVSTCVNALNECLDENVAFMPLPEQEKAVRQFRPIGLGIFGSASMFIKMGIRYGSPKSIELIDNIGTEMAESAIRASANCNCEMPKTPNRTKMINSDFYDEHNVFGSALVPKNCQILTIAPTGSLSSMLGCSGGAEPLFSEKTWRKTESINDGKETFYEIDDQVIAEYKKANGLTETPEWITKSTALNLDWKERIQMQSTWQKHIDNAISSTVNLPEEATVEDIINIYIEAWKAGLKGVTVFRTNCERGAILTTENTQQKAVEATIEAVEATDEEPGDDDGKFLIWGETIESSDNLIGLKKRLLSGCGTLHVHAYFDWNGNFREIYLDKGSSGGCFSYSNGLSRMISIAARSGVALEKIVDQLNSTLSCPSYVVRTATKGDTSKGKNCPNAIGNALLEMQREVNTILCIDNNKKDKIMPKEDIVEYQDNQVKLPQKSEQECLDDGFCPVCYKNGSKNKLTADSGCFTCRFCGFSRCE